MKGATIAALVAAAVIHAGIILFGGLLIPQAPKKAAASEDVDLMTDAAEDDTKKDEAKPAEEAAKEDAPLAEAKEAMPDIREIQALESPVAGPALAPLSLSDLESALAPGMAGAEGGFGGGGPLTSGGRIGASGVGAAAGAELDPVLSTADLDQRPRPIFQSPPTYPPDLRKRRVQGTVQVVFVVDREGRVVNPKIEKSTDPAFERPALEAVRQWRFEAGTHGGDIVQFKMRVPISFRPS